MASRRKAGRNPEHLVMIYERLPRPLFQIVCVQCDAVGIAIDFPEDAPTSTAIKCRQCGAPRGTLGDLRSLASSDRNDLNDFE